MLVVVQDPALKISPVWVMGEWFTACSWIDVGWPLLLWKDGKILTSAPVSTKNLVHVALSVMENRRLDVSLPGWLVSAHCSHWSFPAPKGRTGMSLAWCICEPFLHASNGTSTSVWHVSGCLSWELCHERLYLSDQVLNLGGQGADLVWWRCKLLLRFRNSSYVHSGGQMRRDFHDLAAIILLDLLLEGLGIEEGLNGSVTMLFLSGSSLFTL